MWELKTSEFTKDITEFDYVNNLLTDENSIKIKKYYLFNEKIVSLPHPTRNFKLETLHPSSFRKMF
jgi:DNA/RNA endonuclease YhcR with UshA esterase domain